MNTKIYSILIFALVLVVFLPFFINPQFLTVKDNDLGRTYMPLIAFFKDSIVDFRQIPLWRPSQMMGETLVGNPLFPIFYPPNLLFLFLPINLGAIFYLFLHFLVAGLSTFFLARALRLSIQASFAAALFYALSTKMLVHLEAGHLTMIASFSYFPLALLSLRKIFEKSSVLWLSIGAVSLALMLITYPTIFYYAVIFLGFYTIYKFLVDSRTHQSFNVYVLVIYMSKLLLLLAFTFGLSAASLFPQFGFGPLSTRSDLKIEDIALPVWNLKLFLESLFFPYLNLEKIGHESFLYLGFIPLIFSLIGFLKGSRVQKLFLALFGILTLFYVAGLSTVVFPLAFKYLPLLSYTRITTRIWFAVALVMSLLAARGLESIKNKKIAFVAILLFFIESASIFSFRLSKIPDLQFSDQEIYKFLASDKDAFRVYCTTYCFNPQLIAKYNIQTLHGETPIQHKDFVKFLASSGNYQYSNFAVIFPPYQVWQKENPPLPDSHLLGLANVKYVASTYPLESNDFALISKFGKVFLYGNAKFQKRAFFENSQDNVVIQSYSPNEIHLNYPISNSSRTLLISENYYPGWNGYVDGKQIQVQKEQIFRKTKIPPGSQSLILKYEPLSLKLGLGITAFSAFVLISLFWYSRKQWPISRS